MGYHNNENSNKGFNKGYDKNVSNHGHREAYSFVNPYNFIPFGKKNSSKGSKDGQEYADEPKHTGVIKYTLRTVTPLFIPNTSNENAFDMERNYEDHKSYDFFSYKDLSDLKGSIEDELPVPVIPGSEMRGMLRNHYEILTNSCMFAVDDEARLSKRTQEKYMPGLLERCEREDGTVKYRLIRVKDDCLLRTKGKNSLKDDLNCWADKDEKGNVIKGREEWGRQCYIQEKLAEGEKVIFTYVERKKEVNRNGWGREENAGKPLALEVKPFSSAKRGKAIGYLIKGEKGPEMEDKETKLPAKQKKHCAHIFREPGNIEGQVVKLKGGKEFDEAYLESVLDAVLAVYEKNGVSIYKEYREKYIEFKKGKGNRFFPVYYSLISYGNSRNNRSYGDNGNAADSLMLSPACITREIYTRKLFEMVKDNGSCEKTGGLCPACALFGTFRKNGNVTSRIRVTDLKCLERDTGKCFDTKPITLQTLSQPKFNPEFYMEKPDKDAVFWTYEYYVDSKKIIHKNEAGVNGRKFYWHHPNFNMEKCMAEPSNINKTIRPLNQNIYFSGKIYFQDLSETELNTVCYLINAGDDEKIDQKKHGYKLGAAKPLGFGSVAMHVDDVRLRQIEKTENRIILKEIPYEADKNNTLVDADVAENFEIMTNFYVLDGQNVDYPRKNPGGDIFGWFASNHKGYAYDNKNQRNKPVGMPQSRTTMLFDQYLKPMEPKTVSTGLDQKIFKK